MTPEPVQPINPTPIPEEEGPGAFPSPLSEVIPPLIQRSQEAFHRELPRLLQEHPRKWVAYHGDERIAVGPSKTKLYQECLHRGLKVEEFVVRFIQPEEMREVDYLNDV